MNRQKLLILALVLVLLLAGLIAWGIWLDTGSAPPEETIEPTTT